MKLTLTEFAAGPGKSPRQYQQALIDPGVPAPLAQEATRIRFSRHTTLNDSERQALVAVFRLLLRRVRGCC